MHGSVAEWSIAPVLKTGDLKRSVSSNLTASAKNKTRRMHYIRRVFLEGQATDRAANSGSASASRSIRILFESIEMACIPCITGPADQVNIDDGGFFGGFICSTPEVSIHTLRRRGSLTAINGCHSCRRPEHGRVFITITRPPAIIDNSTLTVSTINPGSVSRWLSSFEQGIGVAGNSPRQVKFWTLRNKIPNT